MLMLGIVALGRLLRSQVISSEGDLSVRGEFYSPVLGMKNGGRVILVFPVLKEFPGCGIFSFKTWTVLGKLG